MGAFIMFIVGLVMLLGVIALSAIYQTWLFMDLWKWFVVPLGVPEVPFWGLYGLLIVAGWPLAGLYLKIDDVKKKVVSTTKQTVTANPAKAIGEAFGESIGTIFGVLVGYTFVWGIAKFVVTFLM